MKTKILTVAVLFGMVLAAGSARAEVMLPTSFPAGVTQYQIAFVTSGTTTGTNGYETYYNGFVQDQAAPLTAMLPLGTSWNAITSTYSDGIDAKSNAPTYANTPIYNTSGQEIAADGAAFWSGNNLLHLIQYDQNGDQEGASTWTGSYWNGTAVLALGDPSGNSTCGEDMLGNGGWIYVFADNQSHLYNVYALSTPIAVPTPEPASLTLFCAALLGLAGAVYLRRR